MRADTWSMHLPGSLPKMRAKRDCGKCGRTAELHGGIQLSPTRWHCAACWRQRVLAAKPRS